MSAVALAYSKEPQVESATSSKLSIRAGQLHAKIDCRVIRSDEDRAAVGRLRYDAYLREGAIAPNPSKSFTDPYDDGENAWIFGLYLDDKLASTVRIHVATKETPGVPSLSVFPDILGPELEAGKTIIDPTRLVTDHRLARLYPSLPYITLRLCWMAGEHFKAEHTLAAVRPEHQAFYKRTFNQRSICGPRPYPLLNKPIALMTVNCLAVADQVYQRYPFLRSTYFERRMLFERSLQVVPVSAAPSAVPQEQPMPLAPEAG